MSKTSNQKLNIAFYSLILLTALAISIPTNASARVYDQNGSGDFVNYKFISGDIYPSNDNSNSYDYNYENLNPPARTVVVNNVPATSVKKTTTTSNTSTSTTNNNTNTDEELNENNSNNEEENVSSFAANALYGSGSFMPTGIVQWIIIAMLILVIVIMVRKIFGGEDHYHSTPLKHA